MTGIIKTIISDKGFGFITRDGQTPDQKDLFFHREKVNGMFEELQVGDKVTFDVDETGPKGPAAINVAKAQ